MRFMRKQLFHTYLNIAFFLLQLFDYDLRSDDWQVIQGASFLLTGS